MTSYLELIRQDVCCYKSCDTSSWPTSVSELVRSLQEELKIPSWLKSGPDPYTNKRVIDLLNQLRTSNDAFNIDIWDATDKKMDKEVEQQLHVVFNTALVDCARIQAVIEAEDITNTPYPKESFLVVLVRNAILNAHVGLSSLEDVPVVLPRHFSGESIPILNYMTKSLYVPLVISICQDMPVENTGSGIQHQINNNSDGNSSMESELFKHSPPTMSEFLDACEGTETPEEVEEDQEECLLSPQFEAYFLAISPPATPPPSCHIPTLCMADEEQFPVLMSSLLYQRRVWHISDPLIGVEFSKYDTTIRLFVGWLEADLSSDRVLPCVHLGEIGTPIKLDLSSPSVALVISRLLCSLESYISAVRDSVRHSVGAVISETQSRLSPRWRIDTDYQEGSATILENNSMRDMIVQWVKYHDYSEGKGTMPPRKRADNSSLTSSRTSFPLPQGSTSTRASYSASPSSVLPSGKGLPTPELREPHEHADTAPTLYSRLSCSAFAATGNKEAQRIFCWMFDRRVIPQSLPYDLEFYRQYSAMTCLIWPDTWRTRADLPSVDPALEPCVQELLESVAALKTRPGAVKCVPTGEFPVDLRILEQSFSAIFQASRRSREKGQLQQTVYEAAWRHDHDRLLFDFFIRLVEARRGDVAHDHSITNLEDPLSRPTLEATLRLPKNDNLDRSGQQQLQRSLLDLLQHQATDRYSWLRSRGCAEDAFIQETDHATHVVSRWASWARQINAETEVEMISKLGQSPSTGRCDALGRLLVDLPGVPPKDIGTCSLVVRASGGNKNNASASGSKARSSYKGQGEARTKPSGSTLTIPDVSPVTETQINGTPYTIPACSISTSMPDLDTEQTCLTESMDALTHKVRRLQLARSNVELPILAVEYKKSSDNLIKGTNQLRMYLTASVKFLQAVGITNMPVYGAQTDGPIVALPAVVLREDGFVYLFERLVERLDISTPLGAWHYATILCRLAQSHADVLEKKFEEVKESLVASLLGKSNQVDGWTMDCQIGKLKAEKRAKSPPPKGSRDERPKAD